MVHQVIKETNEIVLRWFGPICQRERKLMKSRIPNGTCEFNERTDEPFKVQPPTRLA